MSLFDDLRQEVFNCTNRKDLYNETNTALKSATLLAHQSQYWDRDLFETGIDFGEELTLQELDYSSLIPNWRAAKYFRKHSGVVDEEGGVLFTILTPDEMFDLNGIQKNNVCYLAGEKFKFRSYEAFRYILLGCYRNPVVVESSYDSWIGKQHPYAVVFAAARIVFKAIGLDSEAKMYDGLAQEQLSLVSISNTIAKGY